MATVDCTTPEKYDAAPCPTCGAERAFVSGHWLQFTRKTAGITLRELAARLGVSAAYLCDIEHDRRNGTPAIRAAYEAL